MASTGNSWGGLNGRLYFPWDLDDALAIKTLEIDRVNRHDAPLVLEGGSIHVDGAGTLFTTEECLLNPNRNPDLTKQQIEKTLVDYLGISKIIWLGHSFARQARTSFAAMPSPPGPWGRKSRPPHVAETLAGTTGTLITLADQGPSVVR